MTTTTAATRSRPQIFRTLDLPAELQLLIIDFTVTLLSPIKLPYSDVRSYVEQPPITKVSRGIQVDAISSYYKNNTFEMKVCAMRGFGSANKWLAAIGRDNRPQIKTLIGRGSCCGGKEEVVRRVLEEWLEEVAPRLEHVGELEYRVTFS